MNSVAKKIAMISLIVLIGRYAGAATWQDITRSLTDREFYSLAEKDGNLYAGTSAGLYVKSRRSDKWNRIFTCRGQYKGVNHIFIGRDSSIYIATENGLYATNNSGRSWRRIFRGVGKENRCIFATFDPDNEKMIYLATAKGLFLTDTGGESWRKARGVTGNSRVVSIAVNTMSDGKRIFLICANEVYKATRDFKDYERVFGSGFARESEDEISEAEPQGEGEGVFFLNEIRISEGVVYLGTNRGLFVCGDSGLSWSRLNAAGLTDRNINDVVIGGAEKIFVATGNGVFGYDGKEQLWKKIRNGMASGDVRKLLLTKDKRLYALCRRRIYRTRLDALSEASRRLSDTDKIFSKFANEPDVNAVIDMAIDYAEVHPDKIRRWRRGAKFRALFPKVTLGLDYSKSDTYEIYTSSTKQYWLYGPEDNTSGWDLNLTWDLADLVWNPSQTSIDVRSKLMVQLRDDIVDEVTRTYFERRRLQIGLLMNPPEDLTALLKSRLRIQELTAGLDGLTGGRFSKTVKKE